jgi:putative ABC transport system ATP-binding protein
MSTPAIEMHDATRAFPGGVRALDRVSLTVAQGEWTALMGPSGSGKTTLLNLVDGLDRTTEGSVRVLGVDTTRLDPDQAATFRRENLGLVFQQFHLIPYLTALENVMLAQHYHSMVDREEAMEVLRQVQMQRRTGHLPSQLSGGEQQRVCIARALINDPKIVLADEPTGNLDEANEEKVMEIFEELHRRGKTLLVATHDRAIGGRAHRTLYLQHGRMIARAGASRSG